MSGRAAKLLLEVAKNLAPAASRGAFRKPAGFAGVSMSRGLAEEILAWERGCREHLAHAAERAEGLRKAKERAAEARDALRNEEALERVRLRAARKDADDFGCVLAQEALDLLEGRR